MVIVLHRFKRYAIELTRAGLTFGLFGCYIISAIKSAVLPDKDSI